jgi:hypothetical protein
VPRAIVEFADSPIELVDSPSNGDPMQNPVMPLDPLSLTRMGVATWLTGLFVAQKFSEALWRQSTLMIDGNRALTRDHRAD